MTADRQRLLKEGLCIAGGQLIAALGTLAGMRALTEVAAPALLGEFVLITGVLALAQGVLFLPFGQAILRYYAEWTAHGEEDGLRRLITRTYARRFGVFAAGAVVLCLSIVLYGRLSWLTLGAALAMVALEGWKVLEIALANAARRQAAYSVLTSVDAVLRPFAGVGAALLTAPTVEALLGGQCLSLAVVLTVFRGVQRKNTCASRPAALDDGLVCAMHRFAKPLLWMPLIGWVSGLSDRYVLGAVVGLDGAGMYAAAYGVASRPFLLLGTVTEATLRQPFYASFSGSEAALRRRRLFMLWLAANLGLGAVGAALIWLLREPLTWLLLAAEYQATADLLAWIAAGHVLLIAAQAVERVVYAAGRTGAVAIVQAISASLALLLAYVGARIGGMRGVAMMVPAYNGVQLMMTLGLAGQSRTRRSCQHAHALEIS